MCDNQLFQQIIYRKTSIIVKPDIDILILLENFYQSIEEIMQETYPKLPIWVNKPVF